MVAAADTIAVDEELLMHLAVVSIARAEPLESLFISATTEREPSPASDEEFIQDQAIKRGNYGTWMCKRCEYRDDMAGMMTHLKRYHME